MVPGADGHRTDLAHGPVAEERREELENAITLPLVTVDNIVWVGGMKIEGVTFRGV